MTNTKANTKATKAALARIRLILDRENLTCDLTEDELLGVYNIYIAPNVASGMSFEQATLDILGME